MKIKKNLKKKLKLGMLEIVKQALSDDKIIDLRVIDIRKKSSFADYLILGTGTSNRHIVNMAKNVKEKIKANFNFIPSIEGIEQSDWVLIDAETIVINIFKHESRKFYNLENIWED